MPLHCQIKIKIERYKASLSSSFRRFPFHATHFSPWLGLHLRGGAGRRGPRGDQGWEGEWRGGWKAVTLSSSVSWWLSMSYATYQIGGEGGSGGWGKETAGEQGCQSPLTFIHFIYTNALKHARTCYLKLLMLIPWHTKQQPQQKKNLNHPFRRRQ